jgi:tetratricopeptide (TPR) repeat protein
MPRLVGCIRSCALVFSASLLAIPFSLPLSAQTLDDNFATAPEQLRRIEPPNSSMSLQELEDRADELRGAKAYADALDYYRAALARANEARILNKMGMTELMMMRYDEAERDFQRAIRQDKTYPDAYNNLGVIKYIKRSYRSAIKNYSKALQLREDSASYHSNIGTAYFARKDLNKAMEHYQRALDLDPDVFDRRSKTGISAHMASDRDRAHYDYVIAKMFAIKGDSEHALLYLRKALEDGYAGIDDVYRENEFAAVRKNPKFAELMLSRPASVPN